MGWEGLGRGLRTAITLAVTGVLVVVGLLNGACSTTPPSGNCWRPGECREVGSASSCAYGESFSEGDCETLMQVGTCVSSDGDTRVHLYAPLHGLFDPDCAGYTGAGSRYERR
jgi:hypothetical protein